MKIYIQARGSYETLLNLSTWADLNDIERIGLPDHYIVGRQRHNKENSSPALDLLTAIAGLVRDTEKMVYSILVSPIPFRHPSVLVKMASTRLEMLEESLIYIREALSGNNQGFKGEHYQLEKFPVEPAALSEIPIIIGGGGKVKTPTLAGKYSDEYNIYAGPKATLNNSIKLFKTVASENGRNEKALEITTACPPVVGLTKESVDNSLITAAKALIQPEDEIAKNWKERSYLYGTPEEVVKTLSMWQEVGINAVYLQLLDQEPSKRDESVEVIQKAINLL